jgi:hypothetical protein
MNPEAGLIVKELRTQVERQDARTERECGKCLTHIARVLLPTFGVTITYVGQEQKVSTGSVDLIVIADEVRPGNNVRREAFIWELKAPQLHLFQIETQNRACPTSELIKAENQLLYYHAEVAKSGHLRERWRITSPDHVNFGGIIMGRDDRIVRSQANGSSGALQLASQALEIREQVFYKHNGIELWTWDKVLAIAESQIISHKRITGDPEVAIDLKGTTEPAASRLG